MVDLRSGDRSEDFDYKELFSAKVVDAGNHRKHREKIPQLDLSTVSAKQNLSLENKEPDPALEITKGIKEIEKSMLQGATEQSQIAKQAQKKTEQPANQKEHTQIKQ